MASKVSSFVQQNISSSSSSQYLDIDRIRANPVYATYITIDNGIQLQGLLDSGQTFDISTGAEYTETTSMPSFASELNGIAGVIANTTDTAQFSLKATRLSELAWSACKVPSFTIALEVPIVRATDDPWKYIDFQLQCTMPSQAANDSVVGGLALKAPNDYRVTYGDGQNNDIPHGTVTLQIGNWFRAPRMVILDAQTSISGKKHYDGTPMSVNVMMTFRFWRQPTYEDAISWFILAGNSSVTPASSGASIKGKVKSNLSKAASAARAANTAKNNAISSASSAVTVARNNVASTYSP